MKQNIKVAKQLVKLAKELVGLNEFQNFPDDRASQVMDLQTDEFCDILKTFLLKSKENAANNQTLINTVNDFNSSIENAQENISKLNNDLDNLEEKTRDHRFFMSIYTNFRKQSKKFDILAMLWRLNRVFQLIKKKQKDKEIKVSAEDEELFNKVIQMLKDLKMKAFSKSSKQQGDINTEKLLSISEQIGENRLRIRELMKKLNNENKNIKMVIASVEEEKPTVVHAMNIISTINRDKTILDMRKKINEAIDSQISENIPKEPSQTDYRRINKKFKEKYDIQDEKTEGWEEVTNIRNASFLGDIFKKVFDKVKSILNTVTSILVTLNSSFNKIEYSCSALQQDNEEMKLNNEYRMFCQSLKNMYQEMSKINK